MYTDALGNEIKVGDAVCVAVQAGRSSATMRVGRVKKFTAKMLVIEYRSWKYERNWNNEYVKRPSVAHTSINFSSDRVVVVNKVPYDDCEYDIFDLDSIR